MKGSQKLSLLFLLVQLLTCAVYAQENSPNMITKVQILCRKDHKQIIRQYVQPHKISAVLNYLRLLESSSYAEADPEQLSGNSFRIVIYDNNGQTGIYRQQADRYFSKNSRPWKKISPEQACRLYPLLQAMPTDQ